jgi:hypothetical protein
VKDRRECLFEVETGDLCEASDDKMRLVLGDVALSIMLEHKDPFGSEDLAIARHSGARDELVCISSNLVFLLFLLSSGHSHHFAFRSAPS